MVRNTQTSLRIRRPPLCLLTLVADADLTSESGERRLVSQPIGRVTAHNPVNCILVILTPSCGYPVDRGCRCSSTRRLFTCSLLPARVLNSGPHDSPPPPIYEVKCFPESIFLSLSSVENGRKSGAASGAPAVTA